MMQIRSVQGFVTHRKAFLIHPVVVCLSHLQQPRHHHKAYHKAHSPPDYSSRPNLPAGVHESHSHCQDYVNHTGDRLLRIGRVHDREPTGDGEMAKDYWEVRLHFFNGHILKNIVLFLLLLVLVFLALGAL